jgi:protocatechuate 3,4-dioxygenase, alpha subunit
MRSAVAGGVTSRVTGARSQWIQDPTGQCDEFLAPSQDPHINVIVFMRGVLLHAYTRMYFEEEWALNDKDPVLQSVPPERRGTLLAQRAQSAAGVVYRWDIHMQGEAETVFFDA